MRVLNRVLIAGLLLAVPSAALAQGGGGRTSGSMSSMPADDMPRWVSTALGASFGGDAHHTSAGVGVSGGMRIHKWLGVEGEVTDAPDLFEQDGFLTSRRVTTIMGNAIVPIRTGDGMRIRPYVIGGLGLIHSNVTEAGGLQTATANKLGFSVGGGAMADLTHVIGVRADIRYLRGTHHSDTDSNAFGIDFSSFGFWRVSGGLVVRY